MIKTSKLKIVSKINMATNDMNNHNSHTQVTGHKPQFTNDNKTHTRFLASYTTTGHKPTRPQHMPHANKIKTHTIGSSSSYSHKDINKKSTRQKHERPQR